MTRKIMAGKKLLKLLFVLYVFVLSFCLFQEKSLANSHQEDDLGLWINTNISLPITEKIQTRFQISPRLLDNITDFNEFVLHSTIGYKFNENFSVWQGHAWSTTHIPRFRREQRIYQEFIHQKEFLRFKLENRLRLDERFIQNSSFSFRPRYRLKAFFPFGKNKDWHVVAFDELFLNLTSSAGGPQQGINQNRIYIGLRKEISKNFAVEGGYQLQHINSPSSEIDKFNHFILFNFDVALPKLFSNN